MTNTETAEGCDTSSELGLLFQHGREKRNLTIEDVAAELKVLNSAVKGIESGDYRAIKGEVFVKGYLKAYAKFLQLDVDACLAMYAESVSAPEDTAPTVLIAKASENARLVKIAVIAVVAIVFIGIVYLVLSDGDSNEKVFVAQQPASESLTPAVSENASATIAMPPELAFDDLPITASVVLPAEPDAQDAPATVVKPEKHTLSLAFSADCWVEVNDANGKKLISDLKRDGERIELNGQPPYEVLLGYGPAVAVSYQGESVSFEVGRNPTVKLSIGDKQ